MISRLERFVIALIVALVIAGASLVVASAQSENPPVAAPNADCASCHPERHAAWAGGPHGAARTNHVLEEASNCSACHKSIENGDMSASSDSANPTFATTWKGQGMPVTCLQCHATGYDPVTGKAEADGVTCQACHSPVAPDHPNQDEPINTSTDLCRNCHSDSRFGWDTWKASMHYQQNLTCITCHDPHSASLKLTDPTSSDISSLCVGCHKNVAKDAQHSKHNAAGVTCVTCHLGPKQGNDDYHQVPDHSFVPTLETCNGCHADQMHGVGKALTLGVDPKQSQNSQTAEVLLKPMNIQGSVQAGETSSTPTPANVMGYMGMAVVIGLVGGMVVSLVRKH